MLEPVLYWICVFVLVRNFVVGAAMLRAIPRLHTHPVYRPWLEYPVSRTARMYFRMIFQLQKWRFSQFYPELKEHV